MALLALRPDPSAPCYQSSTQFLPCAAAASGALDVRVPSIGTARGDEVRARLIISCAADEVVDIDTGHTPALDAPTVLALLLDHIIDAIGPR